MKTSYLFLVLFLISWTGLVSAQVDVLPHNPQHYEAEAQKAAQRGDAKSAGENHLKAAHKYLQLADAAQSEQDKLNLFKGAINNLNQAKHFFARCGMTTEVNQCNQLLADVSKDVKDLEAQIRNASTNCKDGEEKWGEPTTHLWRDLPSKNGSIKFEITSAVPRGDLAGMGFFFRAIAKAIGMAANQVQKVPGGHMLSIPMQYFEGLATVGGKIVDAGERIRDADAKKVVNLKIYIPRINKTVICKQRYVCENGAFVAKDRIVIREQDTKTDYARNYDAITYKKAVEIINQLKNNLIKRMRKNAKAYAAAPCTGNANTKKKKPKKKKDCSKLQQQVKQKQRQVNQAKTKMTNATNKYNAWKRASRNAASLKQKMEAAQKAVNQARQKVQQLKRRKTNMEKNYKNNGQTMPAAEAKKYDDQIAAAEADLVAKKAALAKAKKAYQAVSPQRGQKLKAAMEAAKKAHAAKVKELNALKAKLRQCLQGK